MAKGNKYDMHYKNSPRFFCQWLQVKNVNSFRVTGACEVHRVDAECQRMDRNTAATLFQRYLPT